MRHEDVAAFGACGAARAGPSPGAWRGRPRPARQPRLAEPVAGARRRSRADSWSARSTRKRRPGWLARADAQRRGRAERTCCGGSPALRSRRSRGPPLPPFESTARGRRWPRPRRATRTSNSKRSSSAIRTAAAFWRTRSRGRRRVELGDGSGTGARASSPDRPGATVTLLRGLSARPRRRRRPRLEGARRADRSGARAAGRGPPRSTRRAGRVEAGEGVGDHRAGLARREGELEGEGDALQGRRLGEERPLRRRRGRGATASQDDPVHGEENVARDRAAPGRVRQREAGGGVEGCLRSRRLRFAFCFDGRGPARARAAWSDSTFRTRVTARRVESGWPAAASFAGEDVRVLGRARRAGSRSVSGRRSRQALDGRLAAARRRRGGAPVGPRSTALLVVLAELARAPAPEARRRSGRRGRRRAARPLRRQTGAAVAGSRLAGRRVHGRPAVAQAGEGQALGDTLVDQGEELVLDLGAAARDLVEEDGLGLPDRRRGLEVDEAAVLRDRVARGGRRS